MISNQMFKNGGILTGSLCLKSYKEQFFGIKKNSQKNTEALQKIYGNLNKVFPEGLFYRY